mmetsp:Transcript_3291/g.9464  ORF Transcript_3291/g.9464 Transcript_3291/m.9464 type:complete len:138 (-) Transcript_3291:22-435(-)
MYVEDLPPSLVGSMIIAPFPTVGSTESFGIASDPTITDTGRARRAPDAPHSPGISEPASRPKFRLILHDAGDHGLFEVVAVDNAEQVCRNNARSNEQTALKHSEGRIDTSRVIISAIMKLAYDARDEDRTLTGLALR